MGYFFSLVIHNISYRKDRKGAGLEYIFLPGDSTKNAKEAAENALEHIKKHLDPNAFKKMRQKNQLQIKYLDNNGILKII